MKKTVSFISIVVMLMIVFSSIIQFHHHNDKGEIIFAISLIGGNNHCDDDSHSGCHCFCNCNHSHTHNCDSSNDECSAHLGDYQTTKQIVFQFTNGNPLQLFAINDNVKTILKNPNGYFYKELTIPLKTAIFDGVLTNTPLRAPPTIS